MTSQNEVKGLADQRIQAWRAFIAEQERIEAERQRWAEEAARRETELERRRQEAL